jgi:hypothetical protein
MRGVSVTFVELMGFADEHGEEDDRGGAIVCRSMLRLRARTLTPNVTRRGVGARPIGTFACGVVTGTINLCMRASSFRPAFSTEVLMLDHNEKLSGTWVTRNVELAGDPAAGWHCSPFSTFLGGG